MDTFGQESWGNPFAAAEASPLNGDWSGYMTQQLPSTGWWKSVGGGYGYSGNSSRGIDYAPGGRGSSYSPDSAMTNKVIDADIENWMQREHPELYDFTGGGAFQGGAGIGTVAKDPGFGQFSKTPEVYGEIQAAANKYGVPANFLQAIIAKESSGNWAGNSRPVSLGSRGGKRIHGFVGVFEDAAASWGFNFDALIGNRAGQIEMLASGLRGMYDRLRKQNPQYGWLNVAANHYSGDPTGAFTPGDSWQHGSTNKYMTDVESWWKRLDGMAGNTWSNFTDVGQNTGVGSPQNQTWGQYAKWDTALVGLSSKSGAPANMLKAVLRYGQESGAGYATNFDASFAPLAERIATNYTQLGSWDKAVGATLGVPENAPVVVRIRSYWDELNADMSGVFGGSPNANSPKTQMESIWAGISYGVSQENGEANSWTAANPSMYKYGPGVGITNGGHPGMDVVFPRGTKLYSPVSGTVTIVGPQNGYGFYGNGAGNSGQLRIRTDDGHDLILGHMQMIGLQVGARVTPGMYVGTSGGAGSGDHLHLEYRVPDTSTSTGWRSVDPRGALAGQFTGYNQGARTGLGYTQPLTFANLMRAGASGTPIPSGATFTQGGGNSGWTSWLANTMKGIQNQETRSGQLDYSKIYAQSNLGIT